MNGSTLITPITKMFNGLYGQPDRIALDVQQDLTNGLFATEETSNQDVENLKNVIRDYFKKVNQAIAEVTNDISKLAPTNQQVAQKLAAVLYKLNDLKAQIHRDADIIVANPDSLTVESLSNNITYEQ